MLYEIQKFHHIVLKNITDISVEKEYIIFHLPNYNLKKKFETEKHRLTSDKKLENKIKEIINGKNA